MIDERDCLTLATEAADLAFSDPATARRIAREVRASGHAGPAAASVAEQALGLACLATGDLAGAEAHLRTAISLARFRDLRSYAAEARGALGYVLTLTGRTAAALRELERALPDAEGPAAARLRMQRAVIFTEIGRLADAMQEFTEALQLLRRVGGDELIEATIRNNRSILLSRIGNWRGAEADLLRAEEVFSAGGHHGRTAMVYQNRGLAATVRGDIPAALAAFDESARRYRVAGTDPGLLWIERAEALLSVRLLAEAGAAASVAVAEFTHRGNAVDLVQARLVAAKVALANDDPAAAAGHIRQARQSAIRQGRPGWVAIGNYLAVRARSASGDHSRAALQAGQLAVASLVETGWAGLTFDARLMVARLALVRGRRRAAIEELTAAAGARHRGAADSRARAWHATALLRLESGDRRAADCALRAGVRVLEDFNAGLGATELRAYAAGHAHDLTDLGVRLAIEARRPERVFRWAERQRGWALRQPPVRPPDDEELAIDLAALRQVMIDIETAVARGTDPRPLMRSQARIEQSVRDRSRHATGTADPRSALPATAASVLGALGESAMAQFVAVDGRLWVVLLAAGRMRLHRLGPLAEVQRTLDVIEVLTRRLSYGEPPQTLLDRLSALTERIDQQLVRPFDDQLEDRALLIVPTGPLHAVPWSLLPSCRGRPVTVTPTASLWLRAATAPPMTGGRRVLVAGPGLAHAAAEISALSGLYPDADCLSAERAQVESVLTALDGARLGHLAAHGRFRADNPQFSSLRLADGQLTVYDLQRLRRAPRDVVMSACDSGRAEIHPGDELIGLAAALLAMGTVSLVATIAPVLDGASRALMVRYHRRRIAGNRPAEALAAAQDDHTRNSNLAARVEAARFVCFGAG